MSDTPRTDAAINAVNTIYGHPITPYTVDTLCRQLERELAAMTLSLERSQTAEADCARLTRELNAMTAEREELKYAHDNACKLVAMMHAAAVGEVRGPTLGVVEDVKALREERDFLNECLSTARHDTKHFESECVKLREAMTADAPLTVPERDYSSMTPKDCYEAGLMDGGYAVREAIKIAAGEKP